MFEITKGHYAATWLLDARAPKIEMPDPVKKKIARMKAEMMEEMHNGAE